MKTFLNRVLSRLGYMIISRKTLRKCPPEEVYSLYGIDELSLPLLKSIINGGLKDKLIRERKNKWLEIGCGGTFDPNFNYIDLFPETIVGRSKKYFRIDISNILEADINRIGMFDLIRMQHVFEHFTPEDGLIVLKNCARLLNPGGYLLITTPDLKKYINLYLNRKIRNDFDWALKRIDKNSPDSFYFSVFSHSLRFEKHEWCYDAEGIIYQLNKTEKFYNIREIKLGDELASIPFTHNRPKEDVCIIANLKPF